MVIAWSLAGTAWLDVAFGDPWSMGEYDNLVILHAVRWLASTLGMRTMAIVTYWSIRR